MTTTSTRWRLTGAVGALAALGIAALAAEALNFLNNPTTGVTN